ncbi:Mediator of RNA polymerase II transcription subunit 15a [Acorus calamus]|uniref:Mediator of RNA polymerase II transcription subunit 15a n=1 Tax=Acorus calamus TaxID=4465 RepID=A0AAV9EWV4_ACOCL|nr:Mediator of RNA polymerase II transcription subunit 15a [Acorus calamus]
MDPSSAAVDWRSQLQQESRNCTINNIMKSLKRHLPINDPEGMIELKKIVVRFEEKIYATATSQTDYLRRISLKMLTMDTKYPGGANPVPPNAGSRSQNSPDLVRRMAPKRRIPQTASYQRCQYERLAKDAPSTSVILHIPQVSELVEEGQKHITNAARHLYPILEHGITIEAAQRLARDVIHYLEDGISLPDAASMQRRTKQRHDQNA